MPSRDKCFHHTQPIVHPDVYPCEYWRATLATAYIQINISAFFAPLTVTSQPPKSNEVRGGISNIPLNT